MPKVFDKAPTKMPTKTVSRRGLGSWQDPRTPSELFELAGEAVQSGEWRWDDFIIERREDHEQMGFELGERVVQAKSYINGMFATSETEADGATAKEWATDNSEAFDTFLANLAHLEVGQEIYSKGALEVAQIKERAARELALRETYEEGGGLLLDFLGNIPVAAKDLADGSAEFVGELGGKVINNGLKATFPWGWVAAAAAGFGLLTWFAPRR